MCSDSHHYLVYLFSMGHHAQNFQTPENKQGNKSMLDKLFDKIEKQCEISLENMAEIVNTCDSIEETIKKTKQTSDKLSQQVKEL